MIATATLCLALNIFHEARNQSELGQAMVAYVTLRRAEWNHDKVCETVFAPGQFSWANGRVRRSGQGWVAHASLQPREGAAWAAAQRRARITLALRPFAHGIFTATHYHATYIRPPQWTRKMKVVLRVGDHVFYRPA